MRLSQDPKPLVIGKPWADVTPYIAARLERQDSFQRRVGGGGAAAEPVSSVNMNAEETKVNEMY